VREGRSPGDLYLVCATNEGSGKAWEIAACSEQGREPPALGEFEARSGAAFEGEKDEEGRVIPFRGERWKEPTPPFKGEKGEPRHRLTEKPSRGGRQRLFLLLFRGNSLCGGARELPLGGASILLRKQRVGPFFSRRASERKG